MTTPNARVYAVILFATSLIMAAALAQALIYKDKVQAATYNSIPVSGVVK